MDDHLTVHFLSLLRTSKLTFMNAKIGLGTPAPGVYNLDKAKTKIYGKSSTFSSRSVILEFSYA